MSLFT
jgi:protein phosphatase 1 regulatory subunit 36